VKRLWLAIVGFAAVAMSSALAADMPPGRHMRPPRTPTDVPIFSWNGLYAGINGGYGFGHSTWIETSTLATGWEYAFIANCSAKLEYLYVDLGKVIPAIRTVPPIQSTSRSPRTSYEPA
jgi:opacity protein-like surface antigen